MKISFRQKGDFSKLTTYLTKIRKPVDPRDLYHLGEEGVAALSSATPINSGLTANSWYYDIITTDESVIINFCNSNVIDGVPVAILLQYGHATRNGAWIEGIDFINPAIRPVIKRIAKKAWKEVTKP